MKQTRHNIFETNSSSTHSVSLTNISSDIPNFEQLESYVDPADHYIHIKFGEFGWGYDEYTDAYTKLQYLLNMIMDTHKGEFCHEGEVSIEDFYNLDEFILLESTIADCVQNCKGFCIYDDGIVKHSYDSEDADGNPCKRYYVSYNGYIDHQSYEDYNCMMDFLNEWDTTIEDFVFNENVMLVIDNDNH